MKEKKKHICIMGPKEPGFEEDALMEEAQKYFETVYVKIPDVLIESREKVRLMAGTVNLMKMSAVVPRIPRTYANYGYAIAKLLDSRIVLPNKPESIILSHNKFLTLLHLDAAGIPVPETYLASTRSAVQDVLDHAKYPIVMKLLYGSRGKGVMFADSKSSASSLVDALETIKQPIFIEEYLEHGNKDIRAVVVGGEVVAAMKRIAPKGDMRANIGGGGTGRKISLNSRLQRLATDAADIMGMDIAGVDIIETKSGPKIIEINYNVNFAGITQATGENIAEHIINYVRRRLVE